MARRKRHASTHRCLFCGRSFDTNTDAGLCSERCRKARRRELAHRRLGHPTTRGRFRRGATGGKHKRPG